MSFAEAPKARPIPRTSLCTKITEKATEFFTRFWNGNPVVNPENKYVFITGCDTGFGRAVAEDLTQRGFNVFAGCLTDLARRELEQWFDSLQKRGQFLKQPMKNTLYPFVLDVTKEEDVAKAAELVRSVSDGKLFALVNNAGISIDSNIDICSVSDFERVMDVNYLGVVRVTKALLPFLLRAHLPRVVIVSSVAGTLAAGGMAPYSCSKHAVQAFAHCLRREMGEWGLAVSLIEPGFMRTPILFQIPENSKKIWARAEPEAKERWGDTWFQATSRSTTHMTRTLAEDPKLVVDAIIDACTLERPSVHYRPGLQAKGYFLPMTYVPDYLFDKLLQFTDWRRGIPPAKLEETKRVTVDGQDASALSTTSAATTTTAAPATTAPAVQSGAEPGNSKPKRK